MAALPNLTQVDLRLLTVFTTVVDCGGFSAAQVTLNVGQSTISSHMATLETRLGMRLCERGRAGFRLTEDGRQVYESAQRLLRSIDSFTSEVESLRGRLTGELHIGTVDSVVTNADFRLRQAIGRFKRRGGSVRINLHIGTPAEIERAVVDGGMHIGLGGYNRRISGIEYVGVLRESQQLYCARGHALFDTPDNAIAPGDLGAYDFVKRSYLPDRALPYEEYLNPAAVASNMEAIAILVLSGHFIGYLPKHYAEYWIARGDMRSIMPDIMHYDSQLEMLVRKGRPQHLALRLFKEDLLQAFGEANTLANDDGRVAV